MKRQSGPGCSLCRLFGVFAGILVWSTADASRYSIHPVDDTYVSNITGAGKNYGVNYLYVSNTSGFLAYAYLKFPLDQLAENEEIDTATLEMHALYGFLSTINVYYVAFDGWNEKTITWYDQPADYAAPAPLDSVYLNSAPRNIEFDLLRDLQWPIALDLEDRFLSLMVSVDSRGEVFLASKEIFTESWVPTLNITTSPNEPIDDLTPTPVPSSLALILSGLWALRGSAWLLARKRQLPKAAGS
ncbi:MAG: DNRLRE domain-containing protein [Deltaproteobacteria bacterium]|nr:DNRLRE domain-containing protein [Deltaproteobacteria bacterium]